MKSKIDLAYSISRIVNSRLEISIFLCGMALYQIIHFIGIVAIGHQELWLVEVLFTRVTVSGLLFDWFSFINRLQIEQNLNIRSCTSSWCCIDDFISQELNVGLYLANRAVSDRTCWCRLCLLR